MEDQVTTDLRFSIVPHWIIKHDISDRALRLYSVLAGFADSETNQAFPGRTRLSKELRCSLKSVDRAVLELESIGAIRKKQRVKDGHYQSSLYTVVRIDPASGVARPRVTDDATPRQDGRDPVSPVTHITRTTELEPLKQEPLNDISTNFNQFWELYPRKVGKGKARQAFEKALEKTDIDTILAGVEAYVYHEGYNDMEFIAHPTSWLNGERWDDEYDTPVRKETPGPGKREWVKDMHDMDEHWACEPGEFGCK
jgi:hypothetical protein